MTQTAPPVSTTEPNTPAPVVSPEATTGQAAPEVAGTPRRRFLLSVFILVTLASIFVSVMPDSVLRNDLLTVARPYLLVTGFDQGWGVFAPGPRLETSYVVTRVDFADGGHTDVPISNSPGISEYWNYRWRKYGELMWTQKDNSRERATYATWVVDQERKDGRRPVRVTLFRHTAPNLAPGPGPDTGPWEDVPFFSATVGAS